MDGIDTVGSNYCCKCYFDEEIFSFFSVLDNADLCCRLNQYGNELTGSIPIDVGNLVHLRDLWLNKNQMSGEIPTHMGLLTDLVTLYLQANTFVGTLPTEIGLLPDLRKSDFMRRLDSRSNSLTDIGFSLSTVPRVSAADRQRTKWCCPRRSMRVEERV